MGYPVPSPLETTDLLWIQLLSRSPLQKILMFGPADTTSLSATLYYVSGGVELRRTASGGVWRRLVASGPAVFLSVSPHYLSLN